MEILSCCQLFSESAKISIILPMYPGVPLVSEEFSGFHILAIPKSVMRKYPAKFKQIEH